MREVAYSGDLTPARLDAIWTETYGHDAPFRFEDLERREVADKSVLSADLLHHAQAQVFAG